MRLPSFPTIVRTFYTITNATARFQPVSYRTLQPVNFSRATLRSMPSIPFLGALFGTSSSSSEKMSYPVQKSKEEWQAVLNPGMYTCTYWQQHTNIPQSNSASCARKVRKPRTPASTTSISLRKVYTIAPVVTHPCTKQSTSSRVVAGGLRTSMLFQAQ